MSPVFHINHPSIPQTKFSVLVDAWRGNNSFLTLANKTAGNNWKTLKFWDQTSPLFPFQSIMANTMELHPIDASTKAAERHDRREYPGMRN